MVPSSFRNTGQTFPCVFIDKVEPSNFSSVSKFVLHKVITPNMISVFRTKSDTVPSLSHNLRFLGCFCGTLSPSVRQIRSTCVMSTEYPGKNHQEFPDFITTIPGKNHEADVVVCRMSA